MTNHEIEPGPQDDWVDLAVIIPTCNRPGPVEELIENIKPKLKPTDIIILVNDGDPGAVFHLSGPQVVVVEHCKDYYALASGRNKGLKEALDRGYEWGLCLDDDATLETDIIIRHRALGTAVDNKTILAGKIVTHETKPKDARQKWIEKSGQDIDLEEDGIVKWGGSNLSFHIPTVLDHGGFNEDFDGNWGYEDNEFYWRMTTQHGFKIKYLEDAVILNKQLPRAGDHYERFNTKNQDKLPREAFYKAPEG